ncbi:hypothetical protein INT43_001005 [Umbelopsis isabellina]|uniref:Uncharacterized protein n=1 Tax=Mortierella isabellina TaxID=91625 RepID=A0A8H7UKH7_MORIS|nr:hypothetical protein INT43_001005 [Umbelopsis isabellina]
MSTTTQFATVPPTVQQQQLSRQRHLMLLQQQQRQLSRLGTGTQLTPQQQQQMYAQSNGAQQQPIPGVQTTATNASNPIYNPIPNAAFGNSSSPVVSAASIPPSMASNPALQRMPQTTAMPGQPLAKRMVTMNTGHIPGQITAQQAGPASAGSAILRLLQYSDSLGPGAETKELSYWHRVISDHFSEEGTFRHDMTNHQSDEKKVFEIPNSLLARYYLTYFQSGVVQMNWTLETPMEYMSPTGAWIVDTPQASLTQFFDNGSHIVLNGRLRVQLSPSPVTGLLKIDLLDYSSHGYTEYIPRNSILGLSKHESLKRDNKNLSSKLDGLIRDLLPECLVNDFGVCPRVMRCLEIAEVVSSFEDLIHYSRMSNTGPLESLKEVSQNIQKRLAQMGNAAAMGSFIQDDMLPGSPVIKREHQASIDAGKSPMLQHMDGLQHHMDPNSMKGAGMMTPQQTPKTNSPSQQSPSMAKRKGSPGDHDINGYAANDMNTPMPSQMASSMMASPISVNSPVAKKRAANTSPRARKKNSKAARANADTVS